VEDLLLSPLHDDHVRRGAKLAPFAGWSMPLEFEGVVAEHTAVREAVGVFDVSHLGTLRVTGPVSALDRVLSNDLARIGDGQAQYSLVLNEQAGVVDDLIVYRVGPEEFILIPNAANTAAVAEAVVRGGLQVEDVTRATAVLALQGPGSDPVVEDLGLPPLEYMAVAPAEVDAVPCTVCRTGYTGERGVEILVPADRAGHVWTVLLEAGAKPCGLGARDTLRTEMGYPLHGHELRPDVPARWSSVSWAVSKQGDFVGARVHRDTPGSQRVVGLRMLERGVPRAGMAVLRDGRRCGVATSGTFSPTLRAGIALARVRTPVEQGERLSMDVRGRVLACEVVSTPFVPSHVRGQ
jgi:aminomethyltransferase